MIMYSFSEMMAILEDDKHLAFTMYGESDYRHLLMDFGGTYLTNDCGDRIDFKMDSRMLKTSWFSTDKGKAMTFMELMEAIDSGNTETKPTVRVDITAPGKSAVLEMSLTAVMSRLYRNYTDEEIARIMLRDKW